MNKRGHIELPPIGIFEALSRSELEMLSESGHSLRVPEGTEIVKQGTRQDSLFVIIEGSARVAMEDGDQAMALDDLNKGESFGEMSIIDPAKASASVFALEECLLWRIRRADLDDFILRNPDTGLNLIWEISTLLVRRLRESNLGNR